MPAPVPPSPESLARAVEALLFASPRPVPLAAVREACGVDPSEALGIVRRRRETGGLRLVVAAGKASLVPVEDLVPVPEASRGLSKAALSCAVAVALHGPVSLRTLESLRGVRVRPSIMVDLERAGFVERWDGGGRTAMWIAGAGFLDAMGLASVDDMPTPEEVLALDLDGD